MTLNLPMLSQNAEYIHTHTLLYDGKYSTNFNNYVKFDFISPSTDATTGDTAPFNAGEINPLNSENTNMFRCSYNPPKDDSTEQIV